jgi:hypothetical protein
MEFTDSTMHVAAECRFHLDLFHVIESDISHLFVTEHKIICANIQGKVFLWTWRAATVCCNEPHQLPQTPYLIIDTKTQKHFSAFEVSLEHGLLLIISRDSSHVQGWTLEGRFLFKLCSSQSQVPFNCYQWIRKEEEHLIMAGDQTGWLHFWKLPLLSSIKETLILNSSVSRSVCSTGIAALNADMFKTIAISQVGEVFVLSTINGSLLKELGSFRSRQRPEDLNAIMMYQIWSNTHVIIASHGGHVKVWDFNPLQPSTSHAKNRRKSSKSTLLLKLGGSTSAPPKSVLEKHIGEELQDHRVRDQEEKQFDAFIERQQLRLNGTFSAVGPNRMTDDELLQYALMVSSESRPRAEIPSVQSEDYELALALSRSLNEK